MLVSTHSRLKAAGSQVLQQSLKDLVSTHSRLKAAGMCPTSNADGMPVSTHSRLKAAGVHVFVFLLLQWGFNTQPPEGGWTG